VSRARASANKDADTLAVEKRLSDALGLAVDINHRGKGGVLRVRYRSLDQLDDVIARLEQGPRIRRL
jgi:ParB family chromosome partitioning protein